MALALQSLKSDWRTSSEEEVNQLIEMCLGANATSAAILNSVLNLAAMESGAFSISLAPTSLRSIAAQTHFQLQPLASSNHAQLKLEIDDRLPAIVMADGPRLGQVLSNYTSNALKHCPVDGSGVVIIALRVVDVIKGQVKEEAKGEEGGAVAGVGEDGKKDNAAAGSAASSASTAESADSAAAHVEPLSNKPRQRAVDMVKIRLEVSDNGPGVTEAQQKLLFRPFSQLQPAPGSNSSHGISPVLTSPKSPFSLENGSSSSGASASVGRLPLSQSPSSGLGLSIVKEICVRHGGTVGVTSCGGVGSAAAAAARGSTFWAELTLEIVPPPLPLHDHASAASSSSSSSSSPASANSPRQPPTSMMSSTPAARASSAGASGAGTGGAGSIPPISKPSATTITTMETGTSPIAYGTSPPDTVLSTSAWAIDDITKRPPSVGVDDETDASAPLVPASAPLTASAASPDPASVPVSAVTAVTVEFTAAGNASGDQSRPGSAGSGLRIRASAMRSAASGCSSSPEDTPLPLSMAAEERDVYPTSPTPSASSSSARYSYGGYASPGMKSPIVLSLTAAQRHALHDVSGSGGDSGPGTPLPTLSGGDVRTLPRGVEAVGIPIVAGNGRAAVNLRIAVVDDAPLNRKLLVRVLKGRYRSGSRLNELCFTIDEFCDGVGIVDSFTAAVQAEAQQQVRRALEEGADEKHRSESRPAASEKEAIAALASVGTLDTSSIPGAGSSAMVLVADVTAADVADVSPGSHRDVTDVAACECAAMGSRASSAIGPSSSSAAAATTTARPSSPAAASGVGSKESCANGDFGSRVNGGSSQDEGGVPLSPLAGAATPAAGSASASSTSPDGGLYRLILMDGHMPRLDGLEATRRIRALEAANPHLPRCVVVAVTGAQVEGARIPLAVCSLACSCSRRRLQMPQLAMMSQRLVSFFPACR